MVIFVHLCASVVKRVLFLTGPREVLPPRFFCGQDCGNGFFFVNDGVLPEGYQIPLRRGSDLFQSLAAVQVSNFPYLLTLLDGGSHLHFFQKHSRCCGRNGDFIFRLVKPGWGIFTGLCFSFVFQDFLRNHKIYDALKQDFALWLVYGSR